MNFKVSKGDKFNTHSGVATVINTINYNNKLLVDLIVSDGGCLITHLIKVGDGTYENLQGGCQIWPIENSQ